MPRRLAAPAAVVALAAALCTVVTASHAAATGGVTPAAALATEGSWSRPGPPSNAWGAKAVVDPVRRRLLMFGGQKFEMVNWNFTPYSMWYGDVWSLPLDGAAKWSALPVPAGLYGRESPVMIYDPVRDRLVVFGGANGAGLNNDVWELPLATTSPWAALEPTGLWPAKRSGHSAIYDPVRDRMIVFGGHDEFGNDRNDVWALSLSGTPAWTQLSPTGSPPQARGWHTAIYDPVRDRMVINAGYLWPTNSSVADTWSLSLSGTPAWTPLAASGSSFAQNSHTAVYDPAGDRMILYGGFGNFDHWDQLQALTFSGSPAWSIVSVGNTPPQIRDGHVAVWDAPNQRMLVCSGLDNEFGNAWEATFSGPPAWNPIAPFGTPKNDLHVVVYDATHDRMIKIDHNAPENVWSYSLADAAWTRIQPTGTPPWGRGQASYMYDPVRNRVIMHGGGSGATDVWALNLTSPAWVELSPGGETPLPRIAHSAVYDPGNDRMLVFGGGYGSWTDFYSDLWSLSLSGSTAWGEVHPSSAPPGRDGHAAMWDTGRSRMVIVGGHDSPGSFRHDVWEYDVITNTWSEDLPGGSPVDHVWATAVYDANRARMLVYGGTNNNPPNSDVWSLPLGTAGEWSLLAPTYLPPTERQNHSALYDVARDRMVMYGGTNYVWNDPDVWVWTPASTAAVPRPPVARPSGLAFAEPRPNPAHEQSTFEFTLPRSGHATLDVFDASGRRVRRLAGGELQGGPHSVTWRGDDDGGRPLGSGLYFARLAFGNDEVTRRVVRIR